MQREHINFELPSAVSRALERLETGGFEAYCVGGCVRDCLMGKKPHDFDITTSALPEEVKHSFEDCRIIETGLKHGTVTVIMQGMPLEITTFRTDGKYTDGRRPDSVSFTRSLEQDLARRDFTVNAMAYNPSRGLVDLYGGRQNIEQHIICCVGEADKRFGEDALRILRALRFGSVLGFEIEEATAQSVLRCAPLLERISGERIYAELVKLLCGQGAEKMLLDFRDVFAVIIPQLKPCFDFDQRSKYHKYDVYTHIVKTVSFCEPIPVVRLAALLHDVAKPECFTLDPDGRGHARGHQQKSALQAHKILRALHADNRTIDLVCRLIEYHDMKITPERRQVKRLISKTSFEFARLLMELKKGDILAHADDYTNTSAIEGVKAMIDLLQDSGDCLFVRDLAIGGRELMQAGIAPGQTIGNTLEYLLNCVMDEKLPNTPDLLLRAALEYNGIQ